jgi:hypothetical protein
MAEFEKWGYNSKDRKNLLESKTRGYLMRKMEEKKDFPEEREGRISAIMEEISRSI